MGECRSRRRSLGSNAIPRLTNLAVFVYKQRPDLQAEFPDLFDLNRLGYAAWFLRYAGHRYDWIALFSRQSL